MSEKKPVDQIRRERNDLRIRKNTLWLHKSSGAVVKVHDQTLECESNEWYITYEFIYSSRFAADHIYDYRDPREGINFSRKAETFVQKFEPLNDIKLSLTAAEMELLRNNAQ